jgi:hypothetical protein
MHLPLESHGLLGSSVLGFEYISIGAFSHLLEAVEAGEAADPPVPGRRPRRSLHR